MSSTAQYKLSVIIVNYNVKYYVEQCLLSVQKALNGINAEVFVVDNHSRDASVEYLTDRFPHVRVISSNHNLGFARANNIAIRQCAGQYVLLLNPDTIVAEDTFHRVLSFMDATPQAAWACVCSMLMAAMLWNRAAAYRRPSPRFTKWWVCVPDILRVDASVATISASCHGPSLHR